MKRSLDEWLAWQESAHDKAWDLGLERIGNVWRAMGAPRLARHIITVAGTNGKGSCVCWTEGLCQAHGASVASFSSPHLSDYRERIRFDGAWVDEAELVAAFEAVDAARGDISLSYFEWSALAAFHLIARRQPQVAVLEVGLGGRLDATNLIDAEAARFDAAIKATRKELEQLRSAIPENAPTELGAFISLHLMLLTDVTLSREPVDILKEQKINAEWALKQQSDKLAAQFDNIEDDYLRERKQDMLQVVRRIHNNLVGQSNDLNLNEGLFEDTILIAHDLSPADTVLFKGNRHR